MAPGMMMPPLFAPMMAAMAAASTPFFMAQQMQAMAAQAAAAQQQAAQAAAAQQQQQYAATQAATSGAATTAGTATATSDTANSDDAVRRRHASVAAPSVGNNAGLGGSSPAVKAEPVLHVQIPARPPSACGVAGSTNTSPGRVAAATPGPDAVAATGGESPAAAQAGASNAAPPREQAKSCGGAPGGVGARCSGSGVAVPAGGCGLEQQQQPLQRRVSGGRGEEGGAALPFHASSHSAFRPPQAQQEIKAES